MKMSKVSSSSEIQRIRKTQIIRKLLYGR